MIEPSNMPSLNQSLFGITNVLGDIKANNKNTTDVIKAHRRILWESIKGYIETIKNTIENTIPKDFSEPCSVTIWMVVSVDISVLFIKS